MQLPLNRFERSNPVVKPVKLQRRLLKKVGADRNALYRLSNGLVLKLPGYVFDGGIIPPNLERAELDLCGELDQQRASQHHVYHANERISEPIARGSPGHSRERYQIQPGAIARIVHFEQKMSH